MPRTRDELRTKGRTYRESFKPMPRIQYAVLGDGSGTVEVSGRPGYVHVRIGGEMGRLTVALNKRVPHINNFPVSVGYEDHQASTLQVLDVNDRVFPEVQPWDGEGTVGQHASQHILPDGADIVWVNKKQILPLLTRTTNPASVGVEVYADYYRTSGGWAYFAGEIVDLTSFLPSGYPNAKFVLISLDPQTGTLTFTEGADFNIYTQSDMTPYIPEPPTNQYPLSAIVLTYLGDAVLYNDIYDARQFLSLNEPSQFFDWWGLFQ